MQNEFTRGARLELFGEKLLTTGAEDWSTGLDKQLGCLMRVFLMC